MIKFLSKILPDIFLSSRLLIALLSLVGLFILGFPYPILFGIAKGLLILVLVVVIAEFSLLYSKAKPFKTNRICEDKLSNGDLNPVRIIVQSSYQIGIDIELIDEFPDQFQIRDYSFKLRLEAEGVDEIKYNLRPTTRGEYTFGNINLFVTTLVGFIKRRVVVPSERTIAVYPSFIQLKSYSFYAINNRLTEIGVKKIRKLGLNNEFEQIREYVQGDDMRIVNWRATARKNQLMVNQYQEERSQNVYFLIDKGRMMHMPFDELSLIDYSINASLVMANIAIAKDDKAGLITFSNKIGTIVPASKKAGHMNVILEALYKQKVRLQEPDYARLYRNIKHKIKQRSLLILYTNFESLVSLRRHIDHIRAISKEHLLVVVIFKNSELFQDENNVQSYHTTEDIYKNTIKEKFVYDKKLIIKELNKYGIQTILTKPQDLTVNSINKYIQLKARGSL